MDLRAAAVVKTEGICPSGLGVRIACNNGGMTRSRAPRVLRGVAAASVATFVALLSHVAGGGAMPGPLGVVVPWVLAVMVCTLLAGRSLSLWRLALAVGLSQVIFHTLFVVGLVGGSSQTETAHQHVHDLSAAAGAASMAGGGHSDALMWVWHGIAALATVGVLYRGEHALRSLYTLASEVVATVRRHLTPSLPTSWHGPRFLPRPMTVERVLAPLGWSPDSVARRGPPAYSVV